MIYFTAHTFKCVCHCRRAIFRVLGMYNFGRIANMEKGAEHYVVTLVGVAKYNCNFCLKANIQSHFSLRNEYE